MRYFITVILTLFLAGCSTTPKEKTVIKRIYIKTKVAKAPIECRQEFDGIKPLPTKANINDLATDVIVQRKGRVEDRQQFEVCRTYANKVSGRR